MLGWNEQKTIHLIHMLQHEETGKQANRIMYSFRYWEPAAPGEINYVKVNSYTDGKEMEKTGIESASCILIDNPEDDITLSAALYCANRNLGACFWFTLKMKHWATCYTSIVLIQMYSAVGAEMLAKLQSTPVLVRFCRVIKLHKRHDTVFNVFPWKRWASDRCAYFSVFKEKYQATLIAIDTESWYWA